MATVKQCSNSLSPASNSASWIRWEIKTRKHFFDRLGKKLGYTKMEDWYNVRQEDIYKHKGKILLIHLYQGSPSKALQHIYPQHNWKLWKFKMSPKGYWEKTENQKEFLNWVGDQLGYKCMEEWYKVGQEDI